MWLCLFCREPENSSTPFTNPIVHGRIPDPKPLRRVPTLQLNDPGTGTGFIAIDLQTTSSPPRPDSSLFPSPVQHPVFFLIVMRYPLKGMRGGGVIFLKRLEIGPRHWLLALIQDFGQKLLVLFMIFALTIFAQYTTS